MSVTKGGDTENLGQSCDRQLTWGAVDCLLYSTQSSTVRKRRDHEVQHTTDSLMYMHTHPYLVVLNRGEGRRPQYTWDSVQGIVHKVCHWGWLQGKVEGHSHPLTRGTEDTLQHLERGNCSNRGFPSSPPSGCQLNSMLPTRNSPIGVERLAKTTVDSYY